MKNNKLFFIILFIILIIQFSFLGTQYYTILDDNNQLGCYHLRNENIYENVIKNYKLYNVRPLAFFTDAYIFQLFWNNLYLLLFIIIIMHVLNIFFTYKILEKIGIKLNAFSMLLFSVCPMIFDGLYWISASSRIVFGLFLCLLSIYLLTLSFEEEEKTKKITYLVISIVLNMICVGYYEQIVALNLFLFVFVLVCLKKYKYIIIPTLSTFWIGAWYIYFMITGNIQERGKLNLSNIIGSFLKSAKSFKSNIIYMMNNFKNFFAEGADILFDSILSIVLVGIIGVILYYICKNNFLESEEEKKISMKKIILGFIIIIVPILPFAVIEQNYMAFRTMYIPMIGIFILLEAILDAMLKFIRKNETKKIIKLTIIGIIFMPSIIVNISLLNNVKTTNEIDTKVVGEIIDYISDNNFYKDKKSISLNYDVNNLIKAKGNNNYWATAIEADWATMGKIQVMRESYEVGNVYINMPENDADIKIILDENLNIIK